jgi:Skp family chaperone for outer membrane proteins
MQAGHPNRPVAVLLAALLGLVAYNTLANRPDGIELLRQDLDLYAPGSKQYEETAQTIARRTFKLQAYLDFAVRKLDAEKAKTLRSIYDRIKGVAEEMALEGGYDLVVVDDSIVDLPAELTETETMRQISARRLLYTNSSIEVTEALIERMNERFAQGG